MPERIPPPPFSGREVSLVFSPVKSQRHPLDAKIREAANAAPGPTSKSGNLAAAGSKKGSLGAAGLKRAGLETADSGQNGAAAASSTAATPAGPPSRKRQREAVRTLWEQPGAADYALGDHYYVVSAHWWRHWQSYVSYNNGDGDSNQEMDDANGQQRAGQTSKPVALGELSDSEESDSDVSRPPAIDNWELVDKTRPQLAGDLGPQMKRDVVERHGPVLLPSDVYRILHQWYGGGPTMRRPVEIAGSSRDGGNSLHVNLFPKHSGNQLEPDNDAADAAARYEAAAAAAAAAHAAEAALTRYGDADESSGSSGVQMVGRGPSGSGACETCGEAGRSRCRDCSQVRYCSRQCQRVHWPYHRRECKAMARAAKEGAADGDGESLGSLSLARRGKAGLKNLGNTCFLNSAVQCLSHVSPLTRHLLPERYELNTDNPLGTGGNLTRKYTTILKDLWFGHSTCVDPTELRKAVTAHAPHFSAHVQHDSQEVLSFLLDGLHEDLNRVRRKPAVEMPDGTCGRPDAAVAREAWSKFLSRDTSALVPIFYGQFKSTLACPGCGQVGRKFEPFNTLTLELPARGQRTLQVLVFREVETFASFCATLKKSRKAEGKRGGGGGSSGESVATDLDSDGDAVMKEAASDADAVLAAYNSAAARAVAEARAAKAVAESAADATAAAEMLATRARRLFCRGALRVMVRVDRRATMGDVCQQVSVETGIPMERLLLGEIYQRRIYQVFKENEPVAALPNDSTAILAAYEGDIGPGHSHVTIMHCAEAPVANGLDRERQQPRLYGDPVIISLPEEESCMGLRRRVWAGVRRYVHVGNRDAGLVLAAAREAAEEAARALEAAMVVATEATALADRATGAAMAAAAMAEASQEEDGGASLEGGDVPVHSGAGDEGGGGGSGGIQRKNKAEGGGGGGGGVVVPSAELAEITSDLAVLEDLTLEAKEVEEDARNALGALARVAATATLTEANAARGVRLIEVDQHGLSVLTREQQLKAFERQRLLEEWEFEGGSNLPPPPPPPDQRLLPYAQDVPAHKFLTFPVYPRVDFPRLALEWSGGLRDAADEDAWQEPPEDHASVLRLIGGGGGGDTTTLRECLQRFSAPEQLDESNPWYCGRCKEHRRATKTIEIWRLPPVLIIHLKRFEQRGPLFRDKIESFVDFPIDGLDMAPYCIGPRSAAASDAAAADASSGGGDSEALAALGEEAADEAVEVKAAMAAGNQDANASSTVDGGSSDGVANGNATVSNGSNGSVSAMSASNCNGANGQLLSPPPPQVEEPREPCLYDLFAVSNHMGGMGFGHYTAFVRDWEPPPGGVDDGYMSRQWWQCDDGACEPVEEEIVVSRSAYVLFYRRRGDTDAGTGSGGGGSGGGGSGGGGGEIMAAL